MNLQKNPKPNPKKILKQTQNLKQTPEVNLQ
jgi:hypothetical protein